MRKLQDNDLLEKSRKRPSTVNTMSHVAVFDIFGCDEEGTLLARTIEQLDGSIVAVKMSLASSSQAPGVGDSVLAKTFPIEGFLDDDDNEPTYIARVMKVLDNRSAQYSASSASSRTAPFVSNRSSSDSRS